MKKTMLLFAAAVAACGLVRADVTDWYVDASKEKGSGDGKSPATAYHTINEALSEAGADDVIHVAPGTYGEDEGKTESYNAGGVMKQYARVFLPKRVKLVSTDGREVTFIVGGGVTADLTEGVQCVYVPTAAQGSIIEGFTLCNGGGVDHKGVAGGISGKATSAGAENFTLAYSTVSNCVGSTGAMRGGLAVGCLFVNNAKTGSNAVSESCRDMDGFNCVIANHAGDGATYYDGNNIVHCTIMNNGGRGYYAASSSYFGKTIRNCVCAENGTTNNKNGIAVDSVIEEAWSNVSDRVTVSVPNERAGGALVMAAPLGDFRPVEGGLLAGKAGRDLLAPDWVPAEYRNRDFYGKPIPAEAAIPVGALILESVTPATGATICGMSNGQLSIDGHRVNAKYASYAKEKWPSQVYLTVNADKVPHLYGFRTKIGSVDLLSPADRDGGYRYTLPRPSDGAAYHYLRLPDKVVYVDRKDGDDDTNDGTSWDSPFASLAKACTVCEADTRTLVYVKRGTYDNEVREGVITADVKARVALANKCHASFRAVDAEGAAVTVIAGAPDSGAAVGAYGCGLDAIQGVDVDSSTELLFSGFTFSNCYAHVADKTRAAGFNGATHLAQAAHDCVFDGCVSYTAPVAIRTHLNRCLFRNNFQISNATSGLMQQSDIQACVFEGSNVIGASGVTRGPFGSGDVAYNTSGYLNGFALNASASTIYNSVMCGGGTVNNPDATKGYEMLGMFLWRFATISPTTGFSTADPLLVRPRTNDFRPVEGSPVLTGGSFDVANFSLYTTSDFNNRPMFAVEGQATVPSGAFADAKPPRSFYVSPTGDDTADGLTEATARRTPANAFELTDGRGDTVIALPGVYRAGSDIHTTAVVSGSPAPTIPSRVRVPDGVRFASRDGAAATTIEGEAGVRGVFLEEDAEIAGFTIARAQVRVDGTNADTTDDFSGGGVLGRGHDRAFVEDCVINCCTGISGCVSAYVTLNRCQCLSCDCVVNSANGVYRCSAFNSFFDDLGCNTGIRAFHEIVNCTLGSRNGNAGSRSNNYAIRLPYNASSSRIINVLVLQKITANAHALGCAASNLVFPSNATFSDLPDGALETFDLTKSASELQELYDGTTGRAQTLDAVGVDGGAATDLAGVKDLAGERRVQNGAVDVGCYEADWKGVYSAALGKDVAVADATPGVKIRDGQVTLPAGEALTLTWTLKRDPATAELLYELGTGASLTVTVNGTARTVTDGERLDLRSLLVEGAQTISIAANGGPATLGGLASRYGMMLILR